MFQAWADVRLAMSRNVNEIGVRRSYGEHRVGELAAAGAWADWTSTIACLIVGVAFPSLWFWLLPGWLGFQTPAARNDPWRWIAAVPSVLGFAVALRCVWDFGQIGHGTPSPIAPPKKLVVVGFCRYIRNPMYMGFFCGWIGLWVVFGWWNWAGIGMVALVILGVMAFVQLYEEPNLRRLFGAEYEEYCWNVPRWVPRVTAWEK
jgi:protein-S-isoprenylcysteine O-methyltransferase Ste14